MYDPISKFYLAFAHHRTPRTWF